MRIFDFKKSKIAEICNEIDLKKVALGAIASTPIGCMLFYSLQKRRYGEVLAESCQSTQVNELGDSTENYSLPRSMNAYEDWVQTASNDDIEKYNTILMSLRKDGVVSNNFLQSHNFSSARDFKSYYSNLYDLAKDGDLVAQRQFLELQNEYQDDFFYQSSMVFEYGKDGFSAIDMPIIPIVEQTTIDFSGDLMVGIALATAGACGVIGAIIYKKKMNNKKSSADEKEK